MISAAQVAQPKTPDQEHREQTLSCQTMETLQLRQADTCATSLWNWPTQCPTYIVKCEEFCSTGLTAQNTQPRTSRANSFMPDNGNFADKTSRHLCTSLWNWPIALMVVLRTTTCMSRKTFPIPGLYWHAHVASTQHHNQSASLSKALYSLLKPVLQMNTLRPGLTKLVFFSENVLQVDTPSWSDQDNIQSVRSMCARQM